MSIKANCIDSVAPAEVVFAKEVKKLQEEVSLLKLPQVSILFLSFHPCPSLPSPLFKCNLLDLIHKFRPAEQITLEPYERDHAVVIGQYRAPPKAKK